MSGDGLDHAVALLKQRDGVDKCLKLMRYAAQFTAYNVLLVDPGSVVGAKLKDLDASSAVARKFLKLGKFLGNAKEIRALLRAHASLAETTDHDRGGASHPRTGTLTFPGLAALLTHRLSIACQGTMLAYNFLEQGNWAVKTGLIRGRRNKEWIARWVNWTELATYVFSIQLTALGLRDCARRIEALERRLGRARRVKKDDGDGDAASPEGGTLGGRIRAGSDDGTSEASVRSALRAAVRERTLLKMALAQDCMDAAVVIGDIRGGDSVLTKPWLVGTLGLCSAVIGVCDKWMTTG